MGCLGPVGTEDGWEGTCEGGGCLDAGEVYLRAVSLWSHYFERGYMTKADLANVGAGVEAEARVRRSSVDPLQMVSMRRMFILMIGTHLGYSGDIPVKVTTHVRVIREQEGPVWIEAKRKDVLGVLACKVLVLVDFAVHLADKVLLICSIAHMSDSASVEMKYLLNNVPSVSITMSGT